MSSSPSGGSGLSNMPVAFMWRAVYSGSTREAKNQMLDRATSRATCHSVTFDHVTVTLGELSTASGVISRPFVPVQHIGDQEGGGGGVSCGGKEANKELDTHRS